MDAASEKKVTTVLRQRGEEKTLLLKGLTTGLKMSVS